MVPGMSHDALKMGVGKPHLLVHPYTTEHGMRLSAYKCVCVHAGTTNDASEQARA